MPATMSALKTELDLEDGESLKVGDEVRYVGGTYKRLTADTIEYSINEYLIAQGIKGSLESAKKFLGLHWASDSEATGDKADPKIVKRAQELNGILGWVARHNLHAALLFSVLARYTHTATPELIEALKGTLQYLEKSPAGLLRRLPEEGTLEIR